MHLFPGDGFQESAITHVFLGVLASFALTETLGWVFAGLVVPGYLATLFVVEPKSALVDVVEAALTYFVARAVGESLSRTGVTSRSFGRERFLLLVLVSVLVRVVVEGVLLPQAFSEPSWAYSIGLVLVPLAANACWKTGLLRGVVQNGVPTLLVYALLRWVLLPHTNLSLAGFHLLTEDVAASFLGSPKAYFVLLSGAALASMVNVRWGWDFGGILIPALLGLVVIHPSKLLATGAEALVLVGLVHLLRVATPVGRWNIEGPRRVVLFFSVDYALRFVAAWLIGPRLGGTGFLEITGFGYLLPALLAVKISQKRQAALVLIPTSIVAAAGFAFGSVSGFTFEALGSQREPPSVAAIGPEPWYPKAIDVAVRWSAATASRTGRGTDARTGRDAQTLAHALGRAAIHPEREPSGELFLRRLDDGVCWLGERADSLDKRRGGPAAFLRCREEHPVGVVVVLAAPLASPGAALVAGKLLARRAVDAVVVAGVERVNEAQDLGASDAHEVAVHLAERFGPTATVVDLVDASDGAQSQVAAVPASLRSALEALDLHPATEAGAAPIVRVDASAVADLAHGIASEVRTDATNLAAADELEGALPRATSETAEELLALRRLVLEPLLGGFDVARRRLAMNAAQALGFRVQAVLRGSAKTRATVLVPTAMSPRLGLVVRDDGAGASVVELVHGEHAHRTRFATALAAALDASALVVTFDRSGSLTSRSLLGETVALATWARPRSDRALVRVLATDESLPPRAASIASWDIPDGAPIVATLQQSLRAMGAEPNAKPMSPSLLETVTRQEPRTTPTLAVTPSPSLIMVFGGARTRASADQRPSDATLDDDCGRVASQLASSEFGKERGLAFDLPALALGSVHDRSVTARRRLEELESRGAVKLALVRANSGRYLAVAGLSKRGVSLACVPYDAADDRFAASREASVEACAAKLGFGGSCDVEEKSR